MNTRKSIYNKTYYACYLGLVVTAILLNVTPILFTTFVEIYDFSYSNLGTLVLINFLIQVVVAILFSKLVDKIGFRPLIVFSMFLAVLGLLFYSLTPFMFKNDIYLGLIISTIIFSVACGLFQILLSPIVNAVPSENKSAAMTKLHSFYAWGQIFCVLFITLMINIVFAKTDWYIITLILCVVPVACAIMFLLVPLYKPVTEIGQREVKKIAFTKFFIFALVFILFCGAAEITISQWASVYLEDIVKTDKIVGDILGVCVFSFMLGIGRVIYAKFSNKLDLSQLMLIGCAAAFVCYIIIALSPVAVLSVIAFGLCGLAVSLLWPGILTLTAQKFPKAGSWPFAVLAAVGNIGTAVGPFMLGQTGDFLPSLDFVKNLANSLSIDAGELGLRLAVLICLVFPLVSFLTLLYIHKHKQKKNIAVEDLSIENPMQKEISDV